MFAKDSASVNAKGGTELMKERLEKYVSKDLLDQFQIFASRVEEPFDETKIRIYWSHDLASDPSAAVLANGGYNNFHKLVFVSNHQMQSFINRFKIPWNKCLVLPNAIESISPVDKSKDEIRLGYWTTPHRGLQLLVPVFETLQKKYNNIKLDVFSSFNLYGWTDRDEPFKPLFEACENNPDINYHGSVSNEEIRTKLNDIHIMAYPSIWEETSCLCLMEAMAAGILCVHPNYGALYETAAGLTNMYQYDEDANRHANLFYHIMDSSIESYWSEGTQGKLGFQSTYANAFYTWDSRKNHWTYLLESLLNEPRELPKKKFVYSTS